MKIYMYNENEVLGHSNSLAGAFKALDRLGYRAAKIHYDSAKHSWKVIGEKVAKVGLRIVIEAPAQPVLKIKRSVRAPSRLDKPVNLSDGTNVYERQTITHKCSDLRLGRLYLHNQGFKYQSSCFLDDEKKWRITGSRLVPKRSVSQSSVIHYGEFSFKPADFRQ